MAAVDVKKGRLTGTTEVDLEEYLGSAVGSTNPVDVQVDYGGAVIDPRNVSDRAARLLGVIYGNLGQLDQKLLSGRNQLTMDLEGWLGSVAPTVGQKAMAASLPVVIAADQTAIPVTATIPGTVDVLDRAARLLGVIYGNLGQLDQRLIGGRNLATVDLEGWLGSAAPTVGQKAMVASLPVAIASDQATFPVTVTFPATYDVSDRAARLLGIVYGNLNQLDQRLVGGRNLATVDLEGYLGTALGAANPIHITPGTGAVFDVSDRAARLLGMVYGNLGQLDQRLVSGRNLLTVELDAVQSAAVSGVTGITRLQPWYQPNFTTVMIGYEGYNVGPHGTVTRDSYTVPAGRIAMVTSVDIMIMRVTAPSAAGRVVAAAFETTEPSAFATVMEITSTVGVPMMKTKGWSGVYGAGQRIYVNTADASTGGTYDYDVGVTFMEFDA